MTDTAANSPNDQPSLPAANNARQLNICIASPEFIGPAQLGGTGMAYTAMAQALAAARHQVTCLFLGVKDPSADAWQKWVDKYKLDGLTLIALPQINASELVAPSHLIKSYEAYHWLKRNDRFDIIHFPDRQGPGYHTLTAKHHGLAFARATICVGLNNMAAWLKAGNHEVANNLGEVDTSFMERRAVALADAVVSPSHYLLNWISDHHWEMPKQRYVQQNILPHSACHVESPGAPLLHTINELVYFGTLETRKGISLFCDALDSISPAIAKKIQHVTFLGREATVAGLPARAYVQKRAQQWPFPFQIISTLDEPAMMDYLRQNNRLAVIPSLLGNSPYKVLECLEAGVAFVASRVGGIPELIASADISKVCFAPDAGALCATLCAALTKGLHPARAVLDARANEQAWIALHENSLARLNLDDGTERAVIQALSIDPTNAVALKALAQIYLNAGMSEAALEACQLILKNDAKDAEALQMIKEATTPHGKANENTSDSGSTFHFPFVESLTAPFAHP